MQAKNLVINTHLVDLNKATQALYELSEGLSLLDVVSEMTLKVSQAVSEISCHCEEILAEGELIDQIADSELIEILDEIVDIDVMSELENRIHNAQKNIQDPVINEFLGQLIEKIELRYICLIETIHEFNALFV